jgi:hypothetical protein
MPIIRPQYHDNYSQQRRTLFSALSDAIWNKRNRREKAENNAELWAVLTPIIVVIFWILTAGFIWINGSKIEGATTYTLLAALSISLLGVIAVLYVAVFSATEVKDYKVAKKMFTKEKLRESDEHLIREYHYASENVKKVFRNKLGVTSTQIEFMTTLVSEGYQGSVNDLVTTVKKL